MNNTKWTEIFKAFYYDIECAEDPKLSKMLIRWTTKSTNGYIYNDSTWTHFGVGMENSKEIEWLKIDLTAENRKIVLDILKKRKTRYELVIKFITQSIFADCSYRVDICTDFKGDYTRLCL